MTAKGRCSLTSPCDRAPPSDTYIPKQTAPLTDAETSEAFKARVHAFPSVERYYADPAILNQRIGLLSFIPSKGARPDKDGFFGMLQLRGNFATEEEANERAEFIIRNVDSYHDIYHAYVGRPVPITSSEDYSKEIKAIDIRAKTTEIISEDILSRKKNDEQEIKIMKEREKNLLEESKRAERNEPADPFEVYITNQVKRAQLVWTYHETMKKVAEMKRSIRATTEAIREEEAAHPDFEERYRDKYTQARKDAGIKDTDDTSFMRYLGQDLIEDLPEEPSGAARVPDPAPGAEA